MLFWTKLMAMGAIVCFALALGAAFAAYGVQVEAGKLSANCDAAATDPAKAMLCAQSSELALKATYSYMAAGACGVLGVALLLFARYFRKRIEQDYQARHSLVKQRL